MAAAVYERLKDAIVTCGVLPGENLHEADLAALFNVSKTPVREALHLLRREGLIMSFARHGHQVAPMTVDDVREIYQLRLMVEPPTTAIAAGALSEPALEELRGLSRVRCVHGDEESRETFLAVNRRFREIIAGASGNQRLLRVSRQLTAESERFFRLSLAAEDLGTELVQEREELTDALARRDAAAAERINREQIELSRRRVLSAMTEQPMRRERNPD